MANNDRPRTLCVDEEPNVLEGLARTLRTRYVVETATEGKVAPDILKSAGPFAIVMSDQRMPQMTGTPCLAQARAFAPASVRVLLTGQADMESAMDAVNEGNIFRFLTKPCPTDVLLTALEACCGQYRLIASEKVLLEPTLHGSTKALVDILALANPLACGRETVEQLMTHFQVRERWPVEVTAMLPQIGCVTLPPETLDKLYKGVARNRGEQTMIERMPTVVENASPIFRALKPGAKSYASPVCNSCKPSIVPSPRPLAACPGALAP
jgi:CheY-like chemotaxis protein